MAPNREVYRHWWPIRTSAGREFLVTLFGEGAPSNIGHAGAGRMFSDVWAWDMSHKKWYSVDANHQGTSPPARGWFDADVWPGVDSEADKLIVHGGLHDDNQRLGDTWKLELY